MQLCFLIENNELYLEKVLVDYNDIPVLFVCKDEKKYYMVLCTDIDELKYVVVETTLRSIAQMIQGKITMRDIITEQISYWYILTGEEITEDVVEKKSMTLIDYNDLPTEGAYYKIPSIDIQEYLEKINNELFEGTYVQIGNIISANTDCYEFLYQEWTDFFKTCNINMQEYIEVFEKVLETDLKQIAKYVIDYKKEEFIIQRKNENTFSKVKSSNKITDVEENIYIAA